MISEVRTLQIDLKTAREWYRGDNSALKELSLKVFSKEELDLPVVKELVDEILGSSIYKLTTIQKIQLKAIQQRKGENNISALKQLRILALYYNKGWTKGFSGTGYFISKDNCGEWKVIKHDKVNYPGIPYFKKEEDAKRAISILSNDELERLYTDL